MKFKIILEEIQKNVIDNIYRLIVEKYDPTYYGACNEINATAAVILSYLGMSVIPVAGFVELDSAMEPENEDEPEEGITKVNHFWIISNSKVIDFACKQFEGYLAIVENRDYVFEDSIKEYIVKHKYKLDNQFVDKELVNNIIKTFVK